MSTSIELPMPPSINRLNRAVAGRSILSAEYRRWRERAGIMLLSQRPERHKGQVSISVDVLLKDKRRRDIDNVGTKAVLDLLTAQQIIPNDDSRYVRAISARWVETGPECVVTITDIGGDQP